MLSLMTTAPRDNNEAPRSAAVGLLRSAETLASQQRALGVLDTLHFWRERQMLGIRVTYYDDSVKHDEVSVF